MEKAKAYRPGMTAMVAGGVASLLLYGWFLTVYLAPNLGPGDAVVGQAIEALMAVSLFWLVLFVLLAMDRVFGGPSWTRRAGFVLIPVCAIAMTFATDYPSDRICQAGVLAMPVLALAYVLLGRLPERQAARAQAAALLPMVALSAYAIRRFLF
jgi:hypothetical protein